VRPYHEPKSHADVMRMLFEGEARKFDAHVLTAFASVIQHSAYRTASP